MQAFWSQLKKTYKTTPKIPITNNLHPFEYAGLSSTHGDTGALAISHNMSVDIFIENKTDRLNLNGITVTTISSQLHNPVPLISPDLSHHINVPEMAIISQTKRPAISSTSCLIIDLSPPLSSSQTASTNGVHQP